MKRGERATLEARFWPKVGRDENGCWPWLAAQSSAGYGVINSGGRGRLLLAHRVSYMMAKGPIPEGLELDHICRVRHCVNPAHLEAVTRRENVRRGLGNPNKLKTHCKHGHEFTPENTHVDDSGYRHCRKCHVRLTLESRARKRAAA